jgi:hypothetical protein
MFSVFKWTHSFIFPPFDVLTKVDAFELSHEWPYLEATIGNRIISRGHMNRTPQNHGAYAPLLLYNRNRFFKLDPSAGEGSVISFSPDPLSIPGICFSSTTINPQSTYFSSPFDFHIMMTVLHTTPYVSIIESALVPSLTNATIISSGMKMTVHSGIFAYTSTLPHEPFRAFCTAMCAKYHEALPSLAPIFANIIKGTPSPSPDQTHLSIAFYTWSQAARENQRTWPGISRHRISADSIEFPSNSGHWYTPPENMFVGLSVRQDDHPEQFIPKVYIRDHRLTKSCLNSYLADQPYSPPQKIPSPVRSTVRKMGGSIPTSPYPEHTGSPAVVLQADGTVIEVSSKATIIVYQGFVISSSIAPTALAAIIDPNVVAQILDIHGMRIKVAYSNSTGWVDSFGPKITDIISLPHSFKQIVHDYNKAGRLRDGPLCSLDHIGIFDPKGTDTITVPKEMTVDLYVSEGWETHRLALFKHQTDVYDRFRSTRTPAKIKPNAEEDY